MSNGKTHYPVVGRSSEIDLTKYTVTIHGRDVIDYEKVKKDDPVLYQRIVDRELETDRLTYAEIEKLRS
jgi:hypothetical protein